MAAAVQRQAAEREEAEARVNRMRTDAHLAKKQAEAAHNFTVAPNPCLHQAPRSRSVCGHTALHADVQEEMLPAKKENW